MDIGEKILELNTRLKAVEAKLAELEKPSEAAEPKPSDEAATA